MREIVATHFHPDDTSQYEYFVIVTLPEVSFNIMYNIFEEVMDELREDLTEAQFEIAPLPPRALIDYISTTEAKTRLNILKGRK